MRKPLKISVLETVVALLLVLVPSMGISAPSDSSPMPVSRQEFERLAAELAPKVNMFAEIWKKDPAAELFGGTSRDYLYWLKGKLKSAKSEAELRQTIKDLRAKDIIDVRDFILFESDVDVISSRHLDVNATRYGVKKIDSIQASRFDASTPEGQTELKQGFIPAEKIRLGLNGFVAPDVFGDGIAEIYTSRPTVHFASDVDFASTSYAQQKINHPILLAVRYIRILAMDYFQNHGKTMPGAELFDNVDPASEREVRRVIDRVLESGELREFLAQAKFANWLNLAIQKAYRSYTNPTATKLLMEHFRADQLPVVYSGLDPTNQYLFQKNRDEKSTRANFEKWNVDPVRLFSPVESFFEDGWIYHGTRSEQAFRSILFQGILPSANGVGGDGLYGVSERNMQFSIDWGEDKNRLVRLKVSKDAKLVDVTQGYGREVFAKMKVTESEFAELFGVDIVRYPYSPEAFVVKNARALGRVEGVFRKLLRFDDLRVLIRSEKSLRIGEFFQLVTDNGLNETEVGLLLKEKSAKQIVALIESKSFRSIVESKEMQESLKSGSVNVFTVPQMEEKLLKEVSQLNLANLKELPPWLEIFKKTSTQHAGTVDRLRVKAVKVAALREFEGESARPTMEAWFQDARFKDLVATHTDIFEVPVLRDTLSNEFSRLPIDALEVPFKWAARLPLVNHIAIDRIRNVLITEFATKLTTPELERAIADADFGSRAETWVQFKNELAKRRNLQSWVGRTNGSDGKNKIHKYFFDNQHKLWDPALFSVEGSLYYFDRLAAQEKRDDSRVGFLFRTILLIPEIENHPAFPKLVAIVKKHEAEGAISFHKFDETKPWTALDKAMEAALFKVGSGKASKRQYISLTSGWLSNWVEHAFERGADKLRPEALIGAATCLESPKRVGSGMNTLLSSFKEWDSLIRFPQLRKHARGAQVLEVVISAGNLYEASEYVPNFRRHLEEAVNGVWSDHPRAPVWREALKLPRNHPGEVTRYGVKVDSGAQADREIFLKSKTYSPSFSCEMMFRKPIIPSRYSY